ncbi:MAG: hypothetical protein ABI183_11045 [Polyangiaceae bacterium]
MRWWLAPAFCFPLFVAGSAHAQQAHALAGPNQAYVLIEGPAAAVLEQQNGDKWTPVCLAPCDRPYSLGRNYRIAGNDVRVSESFVLQGKPGSTVTLHYSEAKHGKGASVTEAGVIVTILGGLTLVGGVFGSCSEPGGEEACTTYRWLTYTGGAIAVVGVATIVTGIVLLSQGSGASVEQKIARGVSFPFSSAVAQSPPFSARFRIEGESSKPMLQTAPTTPIFSFSF